MTTASALKYSWLLLQLFVFGPISPYGLNIAITGSSQGIGLDAARRLIADGHTVYHACRNQDRAHVAVKEAGGGIPMVCDLADLDSVRDFATDLIGKASQLDILCLNAAVAPSRKAEKPKLTKQGFEECIGVNHLGHFLLANMLKEHLAKSNSARLIVTASSVHDPETPGGTVNGEGGATLGNLSGFASRLDTNPTGPSMVDGAIEYNGGKVYNDSKLCNVLFCKEALKRWGNDLTVRSFNPGFIPSSGLFREPRKDNWLGATAFTFVAGLVGFAVPIDIGGARLAYMATVDEEEVPSGSYLSAEVGSKAVTKKDGFTDSAISTEAANEELATRLWDVSLKATNI